MTNWLASTSLRNTSWPVSGHLIQRFSGTSRRRMERIFGRTTLEIQFMASTHLRAERYARPLSLLLIVAPSVTTVLGADFSAPLSDRAGAGFCDLTHCDAAGGRSIERFAIEPCCDAHHN